jgi:hypothetical protein
MGNCGVSYDQRNFLQFVYAHISTCVEIHAQYNELSEYRLNVI